MWERPVPLPLSVPFCLSRTYAWSDTSCFLCIMYCLLLVNEKRRQQARYSTKLFCFCADLGTSGPYSLWYQTYLSLSNILYFSSLSFHPLAQPQTDMLADRRCTACNFLLRTLLFSTPKSTDGNVSLTTSEHGTIVGGCRVANLTVTIHVESSNGILMKNALSLECQRGILQLLIFSWRCTLRPWNL